MDASLAAVMAGVSREVLVRMIQRGRLKGYHRDRFWYADAEDLKRWMRERDVGIDNDFDNEE